MSKMIQIRNVPDGIHRTLKVRASQAGMSLSDYLLKEIEWLATLPSFDDWWRDVQTDGAVPLGESSSEALRAEREARTEHLAE